MTVSIPVLNLAKKCTILFSRNIFVIISYLLWTLVMIWYIFHKSIPAYIVTAKPWPSAENIGIKVSALSPSQSPFTDIELPIIWQI